MIYNFDFNFPIDQSDLFENIQFSCENNTPFFSIIITPTCDLVIQDGRNKPKAKYLKFAGIIKFDDILNNLFSNLKITKKQRSGEEYIDGETYENLLLLLKNFFNGNIYPRYFYLPPLNNYFSHSIIDFQLIETKKYTDELFETLKTSRIARLNSSWKEAIPVKYSSYYSRVGVVDLSDNYINNIFVNYDIKFSRSS